MWGNCKEDTKELPPVLFVGINSASKREKHDGEIFPWIIIPELYNTWKWVQRNGFVDGSAELEIGKEVERNAWPVYDSETKFPMDDSVDGTLWGIMKNFGIVGL